MYSYMAAYTILGVLRVYGHVAGGGAFIDEERALPGGAAVVRAAEAALLIRPEGVPHGRRVDNARSFGVDHNPRKALRILDPGIRPGLPAVGGFIDPVAVGNAVARKTLTRADVDNLRIVRRDGYRADGESSSVLENGFVSHTAMAGFPQPPCGMCRIQDIGISRHAGDIIHTAGEHRRTDMAPVQSRQPAEADRGGERRSDYRYTEEDGAHLPSSIATLPSLRWRLCGAGWKPVSHVRAAHRGRG